MSRIARSSLMLVACATALLAMGSSASAGQDYAPADSSFNVLPPGQFGGLVTNPNSTDQISLYDGLTPKFDNVTQADLATYFKSNRFGLPPGLDENNADYVKTFPGRDGLKIIRDFDQDYGVPHVYGDNRDDVMYGAGYSAAYDRMLIMDVLRGAGGVAAVDAPGKDAFAIANTLFGRFTPSPEGEAFLDSQIGLLQSQGPKGERVLADLEQYVQGINAWRSDPANAPALVVRTDPWTLRDVLACAAMIGATFGKGGGDEARRSEFFAQLRKKRGTSRGTRIFNDLSEQFDPETHSTIDQTFPYGSGKFNSKANVVLDPGSINQSTAAASALSAKTRPMSNAVLIGASKSATGRPLFVAGPQVSYFYPEILLEQDLHGGGIDARGATFPGAAPYVLLGRGPDYSWSATSSGSDIIDQYVEKLCDGPDANSTPDDDRYMYKGTCRQMTTFNAGTITGTPDAGPVTFKETVHGPVFGYAKVKGEKVALSQKRSTRGREALSALGFAEYNDGSVNSPQTFKNAANKIEFTFNWVYADNQSISMLSSGRLPKRPSNASTGLPVWGTGEYEWDGFLSQSEHPQVTDPASGKIINWNNKPAKGFGAADSNWVYGSIHRSQLLDDAVERLKGGDGKLTLAETTAAMNRAATQDLRSAKVWPSIKAMLNSGESKYKNARTTQMVGLLDDWYNAGSSRLDVALDGKIDAPGAAILDAAYPKIADAVLEPALKGDLLPALKSIQGADESPTRTADRRGSAYNGGWYGYIDKDLRTILGRPVTGKFKVRYCGTKQRCRNSLWQALDKAGAELAAAQGSNPAAWRSPAEPERITFPPLLSSTSMRWTNRPTFQQVMSYTGHR